MSVSVFFRPVSCESNGLSCYHPNAFVPVMKEAFGGNFPMKLGTRHIPQLRALAAYSRNCSFLEDPVYSELIDVIERIGWVEVFVE